MGLPGPGPSGCHRSPMAVQSPFQASRRGSKNGTLWDSHSKVSFDVIWVTECVLWPNRCSKRVANGVPKGVQNELKTRVPTKTTKMWFGTLFATFEPCPPCLKTVSWGTFWGYLSGFRGRSTKETLQNTHLQSHIVILKAQA